MGIGTYHFSSWGARFSNEKIIFFAVEKEINPTYTQTQKSPIIVENNFRKNKTKIKIFIEVIIKENERVNE